MAIYIKLDEWEKHFDKMMTGCPLPKKTIAKIKQMWIDGMPTADVVEVVRCKDCKHRNHCHETVAHTKEHDGFREHWSESIEWCSRGERKGGDDIDEGMAWMPLPKPYKGGAE